MGIFSRFKRAAKSKVNAAVEKHIDPERELELAIAELEKQRDSALKELLAFKTSAKKMEYDMEKLDGRIASFEKKAMLAVKQGDDELAKKCLLEKKRGQEERAAILRDKNEATGYAVELNKSRKVFESKLKMLKLKKGSIAARIAMARGKQTGSLGVDESVFERFAEAEGRIDEEAIEAEVEAAMAGEDLGTSELEGRFASGGESSDTDDALEALKKSLEAEKERKKLGE